MLLMQRTVVFEGRDRKNGEWCSPQLVDVILRGGGLCFPVKTTKYFEEQVLRKGPYLKKEWCEQTVKAPMHREIQIDGRIRHWGPVAELDNRIIRVVTLEDGATIHNAFPDRDFLARFLGERTK